MRKTEHTGSSALEVFQGIIEGMIQHYASENSFHRGMECYIQRGVLSLTRRGSQLMAEVQGSQYEPHLVRLSAATGDLAEAECSCPYEWDGICKHIVATLLTCINDPDRFEERPTIETLPAPLDRHELQTILLKLSERHPDLLDPSARPDGKLVIDPENCSLDKEMYTVRSFLHV
jgi:uncharacterized Zn finger protein